MKKKKKNNNNTSDGVIKLPRSQIYWSSAA